MCTGSWSRARSSRWAPSGTGSAAAFVDGLQLTSAIAAGIAAVLAVVAVVALRSVRATAPEETEADEPEAVCAA
jgi:hypothetical protein